MLKKHNIYIYIVITSGPNVRHTCKIQNKNTKQPIKPPATSCSCFGAKGLMLNRSRTI